MSTNAGVGIVNEDGTVETIYVHSDGYLDYTGKRLLENYNTVEKVKELIALGDLSVLGKQIGEKQDFNKWDRKSCLAYGRDRGEDFASIRPTKYFFIEEYMDDGERYDYNYLFQDGEWTWNRYSQSEFKRLAEEEIA